MFPFNRCHQRGVTENFDCGLKPIVVSLRFPINRYHKRVVTAWSQDAYRPINDRFLINRCHQRVVTQR